MSMPKRELLCRALPLLLFAALLSVVAGLAACTPYQVSDRSMNFNDALQDLDNRQVLINAVRAYKRYPLYYTAVNQISSTGELDGSQVNLSLPFGPVSHNVNSVAPMIKVGTGITLQTNPLDTQDFYEGYMQPIKTDLVGYYLDYGWPRQVIIHAFLREIDLPRDIVEGMKVRLRQVFEFERRPDCTGPGGFGECLNDKLSDPQLLAKMSLPVTDPRSLANCQSLNDLNYLLPGERVPPGANYALGGAYEVAAAAGNQIIRFVNEPADACRFATFQLLSAMLDKLELAVVPVSTPSNAAKPISIPTSQAGVSIKIQNDAASSGTAKTAFALSKVMDPCALMTGNKAAFVTAAIIAAAGPDTVAANPLVLRTKGEPTATDSAAPATPAAPTVHPAAHPAPPPAPHASEPAAPPAKPAAKPLRAATQTKGIEPWQTLCTDEAQVQVVPRSPEAIVFYLGEMIEREYPGPGREPEVLTVRGGGTSVYPLFHVMKGSNAGPAEVSVSLDGETYSIPQSDDFRSTMHTLTLAEQIIGLQKKGTQIPGIVPVQVINP